MRVAYVEPFVRAARDVFKLMMDLEATRGELWACDELMPSKEASVAIGVTGDLLGSILYSFPKEMTLKMVEIMSGMAIEELDSFVASALGEVANIISGNAVTHLSNNNYNCNIVPPQMCWAKMCLFPWPASGPWWFRWRPGSASLISLSLYQSGKTLTPPQAN